MRNSLLGLAVVAAISGFAGMTSANAAGCVIKDLKLDCGAGSALERTQAFASKETTDVLRYPWFDVDKFSKPADLEGFRKSFEKQWRDINRAASIQARNLKRKRISNDEFETWKTTYAAARENYNRALFYYRTLVWHGKTGRPAPAE